jgi:hypothetical protein
MTYQEKLKDPRWQKKRLKILDRDDWACQSCGDSESTLHVHHKIYKKCDPWDYPDEVLITLCETCHDEETWDINSICQCLVNLVKTHFLSSQIINISHGFSQLKLLHSPEVVAGTIEMMLTDETIQRGLIEIYLKENNGKPSS